MGDVHAFSPSIAVAEIGSPVAAADLGYGASNERTAATRPVSACAGPFAAECGPVAVLLRRAVRVRLACVRTGDDLAVRPGVARPVLGLSADLEGRGEVGEVATEEPWFVDASVDHPAVDGEGNLGDTAGVTCLRLENVAGRRVGSDPKLDLGRSVVHPARGGPRNTGGEGRRKGDAQNENQCETVC